MKCLTRLLCVFGLLFSVAFAEPLYETRKKAVAGDASAQFSLGVMYANGDGVLKDSAEAVKWYRKSAEQGNARAQFNLGLCYEDEGCDGVQTDYAEAAKWFRKSAEQGNADAQHNLGRIYLLGQDGKPKDLAEAWRWVRKSANQGYAPAQGLIGVGYSSELMGLPLDEKEQLKWLNKAADQGYAPSLYHLSSMYFRGEGVPKDYAKAHAYSNLSVVYSAGTIREFYRRVLEDMEKLMTADQIAEAMKLARELSAKMPKKK